MDVIIFGKGRYYKTKKLSIDEEYNILCFIDNSQKPGEEGICDGKRVLNPRDAMEFADVPILLMSAKYMEMYEQLMALGVASDRVLFGINLKPAYDPFERMMEEHNGRIIVSEGAVSLEIGDRVYRCQTSKEMENTVRTIYRENKPEIQIIQNLPLTPISRRYGREHGTPIDRYYIENFLEHNREKVKGVVAEFADDSYTKQYGDKNIENYIYHVNGWGKNTRKLNLVTGEGVEEEILDCLICTQTVQFIYEVDKAICSIVKMLKKGGCALITAHGIAQISMYDYSNWGEYWRFTKKTLDELIRDFDIEEYDIHSYGNVKTATAMLYGAVVEDLEEKDFEYDDEQYPVVLTLRIIK